MAQNATSDDLRFKIFLGGHAPRPPSMSCLWQQVAFRNYVSTSIPRPLPDQSKIASNSPEVDSEGLHPLPDKVRAIVEAPCTCNSKQLKAYLGVVTYYAKFLPNLSLLLSPLYNCYTKTLHGDGKMNSRMHLTSLKNCSLLPTFSFISIPNYQFCWHVMHPIMELEQFWHTEC